MWIPDSHPPHRHPENHRRERASCRRSSCHSGYCSDRSRRRVLRCPPASPRQTTRRFFGSWYHPFHLLPNLIKRQTGDVDLQNVIIGFVFPIGNGIVCVHHFNSESEKDFSNTRTVAHLLSTAYHQVGLRWQALVVCLVIDTPPTLSCVDGRHGDGDTVFIGAAEFET